MKQHTKIIEALSDQCGSQIELAAALGVDNTRLSKWKVVGIPPRHWPRLLKIAKRRHVALTLEDLDAGSPLTRKRAA